MPPRIGTVNAAGTGVNDWYQNLPPVTKVLGTCFFLSALGSYVKVLSARELALIWPLVYKKYEVWRLVSNFLFVGGFSLQWLMHMLWVVQYGGALEQQVYQFSPADFVFMHIVCGAILLVISLIPVDFLGIYFCSMPMVYVLVYVWSRNFPDQVVNLFGLVKLQSFYVPFAFVGIDILVGKDPVTGIVGILVGHMYYFAYDLYPKATGRELLKTPVFLKNWLARAGVGRPPPTQQTSTPSGFQAFRGGGRRLGSD